MYMDNTNIVSEWHKALLVLLYMMSRTSSHKSKCMIHTSFFLTIFDFLLELNQFKVVFCNLILEQ